MFDNKYPYTDYHEMNLDWFLGKFKELVETWEQVQSDWNSLHDFVQNYFDNLDVQTEINNKINAMIADGSFATIVTPLVEAALPTIVDGKLPAVVATQIGAVVAAQIDAVVAGQLPAVAAQAAADEVSTWLAAHIDPDTGYVIDDTLTVSRAAADAKTVGDKILLINDIDIRQDKQIDSLNQSIMMIDDIITSSGSNRMEVGYAMNNNTGTMGTTSNTRCFGNVNNFLSCGDRVNDYLYVTCDIAIMSSYKIATFDADNTLIEIIQVSPAVNNNLIAINSATVKINVQGLSTSNSTATDALNAFRLFRFKNLPNTVRIIALETLNNTVNLNALRIAQNSNNIRFNVKTGLTNLYLGYGSGGDASESGAIDDGKYNVAVGVEAFGKNETGDHCTAIGYCALKFNTSGDFNTALGEDALYQNTTGSNNIAIGDHVLQNNNTGYQNIVIGARAMRHAEDTHDNIAIGYEAANYASGNNNIVIGNSATSGSDSNSIIIGNNTHTSISIAGKTIHFNNDGTVTWS